MSRGGTAAWAVFLFGTGFVTGFGGGIVRERLDPPDSKWVWHPAPETKMPEGGFNILGECGEGFEQAGPRTCVRIKPTDPCASEREWRKTSIGAILVRKSDGQVLQEVFGRYNLGDGPWVVMRGMGEFGSLAEAKRHVESTMPCEVKQ